MKRLCQCVGSCSPPSSDLTRRDFLGRSVTGAAAVLTAPAWLPEPLTAAESDRRLQSLTDAAPPRVYRSELHADARLHLGGIGTGNFEIGADGQLTTWQLFNTLRDGQIPFHFALKAGSVARLLQTAGGPAAPRVARIEMTGEYPRARLRFLDPELPVHLELDAFSPFAPLDTALSSTPLAAFVFRVQNPTSQPQTVSLAAFLSNPIGYDATVPIDGDEHPGWVGNINEPMNSRRAQGLFLRAAAGTPPALDKPIQLFVSANLASLRSPPPDRPANLRVTALEELPQSNANAESAETRVIWIEEPAADFPEPLLRAAERAVQAGATLVIAGTSMPLISEYAAATGGQPLAQSAARQDILFDDFEQGYDRWTVTGTAFGPKPPAGTLPNQQRVSGFLGQGLVNTYREGDATTGRATSRPFTIERRFLRFLLGGGSHSTTQVRLVVDGTVVRQAAGSDNERLVSVSWNVAEFTGKAARLEIVDEATGPWGHVNVDQIEFSDQPANRAALELLDAVLPLRFREVRPLADRAPKDANTLSFLDATLRDGARWVTSGQGVRLAVRPLGKGQIVLASGPILRPDHAGVVVARQQAYATLCSLAGATYRPLDGQSPLAPGFGTLALAVLADQASVLPARGEWSSAWDTFARDGAWAAPAPLSPTPPSPAGRTVSGALATTVSLEPGASVEVPFLLTWHYPNKYNGEGVAMGCHYATRWPDAAAVLQEAAAGFPAWRARTDLFRRTFYDSTLPSWLLDCLTANAAIIRHIGVVFRIANGDIYGWEGSNGCCQPTCTHVWGYEQTLARLFPDLEREMRRIDFQHQQRPDGGVNNRTEVPSPARPTGEQPFADGHASCILKAYREALNAPDDAFLRAYWPPIRRAVDYLIARDARSHAGQPAGYLEDDQWNTYDQALHGVTTFISGYYLAALRAGEEWARRVGAPADADRFHALFIRGQQKLVELCWNGEYFQQHLPGYEKLPGEVGPGCMSDQLIGQWWAHQLGLGYLFPREQVVSALQAIFKYNWRTDLTGWKHAPRAFAGDRDQGLIIVTWPKGGRPSHVMLYSDEVWTGIEYQVAAHMIYEGLVTEGLAIVKGARDRYDGLPRPPIPRNPWNEIECGGHYARAMSSWSLLLALSGWEYDSPQRSLRLQPRHRPENFRSFFVAPEGWGSFTHRAEGATQSAELDVRQGRLAVRQVTLALVGGARPSRVAATLAGQPLAARLTVADRQAHVGWDAPITAAAGQSLRLELT